MIQRKIYSPYLQQDILIDAQDVDELNQYAIEAVRIRDGVADGSDMWHMLDALVDAYLTILDRRRA